MVLDAIEPVAPDGLDAVEKSVRSSERVGVRAHELLPPASLLGHELCPLEHRDVLLDRREAHRVAAGELGDALLVVQHDRDDVAACRVGERVEEPVGALLDR